MPHAYHAISTRPAAMLKTKGVVPMPEERRYQAFLVRLWTVAEDGMYVWRASAQDAHTGSCRAFADLAGLYEFLVAVTETTPGRQNDESEKQDDGT
jgi:hypothetical protein